MHYLKNVVIAARLAPTGGVRSIVAKVIGGKP